MQTIYEGILGNVVYYAKTQQEAIAWLDANPTGKHRNSLHKFTINGGIK